ncbi:MULTISPECIES: efflux RND transporter periplasmic adaptor subunit [unclassified Arcicella]|uniref:efflux RND transporter periplasmic adaptor subunit n=1 Tax=unclassified Arcicella TaxID=2644986 RepID=UPI0028625C0F|nr:MULTISPECIES: efflux RND transporter periplasmic adaptor subunit [unclassified Arcicella]MDR6562266.1 RND family efflux transporter MFP subunit [Arcicella sp. BE51]MDR6812040.1 RND family efflux transporter MFP subunit [Arcicella sp. BE140]MDR6823351.1 RND family efflux transporter MFP subunit [Arcicella sp. BE139]
MIKSNLVKVFPLLVTTLMLSACGNKPTETQDKPKAVKVTTQQVEEINSRQKLSYSATIEPDIITKIGFAVPGVINNVTVKEGQFVRQGQFLASIDATEYDNALIIANAGLEQAEDMYQRLNELYQKGSLPAKDYIDIKTKLAQAKASKSINSKHISDSKLYAPMSGIITEKLIERGSMAAPGVPAFTIIKTDKVYAKITVPENEIGSFKVGMQSNVFIPTLSDSVKGTISIINPQADAVSKTYSAKILLNNIGQKLLPGMIANVTINPNKYVPVITIPATAVLRDADDITYVFVVNAEKKAVRKRITISSLIGSKEAIVKDGLTKGDLIIVEGQTQLRDGSLVSF